MKEEFNKCNLCPRLCQVNRNRGKLGFCQAPNQITIAAYYLHQWEEPCITGKLGSGTIFFTYCNLRCLFCQNYQISTLNKGKQISIERFSDICLELQDRGATNINLVTPTHFVPLIIEGLKLAKSKGLSIPIVYNTSGYETVETIKLLDGIIDIYLPDFKYYNNDLALKYSSCKNYFEYASNALEEMVRQKGNCTFDKSGNMLSGVIVRHLILPGHTQDSKKILKYLYDKYQDKIYFSIMNQYTPVRTIKYNNLNRVVKDSEYEDVINYAYDIGIRQAFVQEGDTQSESFIPDFDLNLIK